MRQGCRRVSKDRWKSSATSQSRSSCRPLQDCQAPNLIALWKGTRFVIERRFAIRFDLRNLIAARLSAAALAKALDHHQPLRQAFVEETTFRSNGKTKAPAEKCSVSSEPGAGHEGQSQCAEARRLYLRGACAEAHLRALLQEARKLLREVD